MGNCCTTQIQQMTDEIEYSEFATIRIKEKDVKGRVLRLEHVNIRLTSPSYQTNEKLNFPELALQLSSCVLPGLDPRGLMHKDCQDGVVYTAYENTVLLALYDGHGKEGLKIASFCCKFVKEYFVSNFKEFSQNPENALKNIIVECDKKLRSKSNELDSSLSGATGLVLFITSQGIHSGSVGDSRAILATIPDANTSIEDPPVTNNTYVRKLDPSRTLKPVALTVDQKPNHASELERIEKSGGKVQQLTDEYGNKVGPFRVWQKNGIMPGLAMSRSIGDGVAKEIGVIAEPLYYYFPFLQFRDQFIVMASDGVWDVMENIEVVNFVERFRKKCSTKHGVKNYPHRVFFN